MMFIYKTAKFASVWTTILKIQTIFVHQTLTEHHALYSECIVTEGFIGRLFKCINSGYFEINKFNFVTQLCCFIQQKDKYM